MSTTAGALAIPGSGRSVVIRWLVATAGFPIGGFLGHALGGPATTLPAALISGLIAGAVIGGGQALAFGLRTRAFVLWTAATAVALGLALAVVTSMVGQIDTQSDAALLGAISGIAIGAAQAALVLHDRVSNAWAWVVASSVAWAVGWSVTAGIGVALAAGWPVYGLSGAVVSQVITGVVLWRLISASEAAGLARA